MDPRRSLVAGVIWLVVGLAASFAIAASIWVGGVAREIVLEQHVRRLMLETDQLGSDLEQAANARLQALRDVDSSDLSQATFDGLVTRFPGLGWIALARADGVVIASDGTMTGGSQVSDQPWFSMGLKGPWIGMVGERRDGQDRLLGDLSAPVRDPQGKVVGVVAAHLTWHWATRDVRRLSAVLNPHGSARTSVLDGTDGVVVGEAGQLNRAWNGVALDRPLPSEPAADAPAESHGRAAGAVDAADAPRFERLPDGNTVLVARAAVHIGGGDSSGGWKVQLSEPKLDVYQRANDLAARIIWISACLAAITAAFGALGARHLTNRLKRLTRSAGAVGRGEIARIEIPSGSDEVAQLGAAFGKILDDLRQERSELLTLSAELERRVAVRTREVERLAEESRYAAIVRERLQIARDLHDTLAHSMMAMLSEVRLLRKLHVHDPAALAGELTRAEEVAHEGLNEARVAIAQMRVNAVRDTGLGPALAKAFERFLERTGLSGEYLAEPSAARFGDERAETLFRMAEEVLRNIERHAMATRVVIALTTIDETRLSLRIADDGVGFDRELPRPGHYGLIGLHEQAQLIDAQLCIDSVPGRGTSVAATLRVVPEMM